MKSFISLVMIFFIGGCAENAKQQNADRVTVSENVTTTAASATGCREMHIGKDTAYLYLKEAGD